MNRHALENSIPDMRGPLQGRRMSFPSIQFAGWLGWLAGLVSMQAGAAVAFVVMPALLQGHREASFAGGTLFLGGCLAALGANHALNALQRHPAVVTRWLGSCIAGLALASVTAFVAGVRGGAGFLGDIATLSGVAQAVAAVAAAPLVALPVVAALAVLRGGVLKRVEPVKVATGSPHAAAALWIRRAGGGVLLGVSAWLWWAHRPPATPDLSGLRAKGHTLDHWYGQWRESGHARGVDAFVEAGADGHDAAARLGATLLEPRVRARAVRVRAIAAALQADLRSGAPLTRVTMERDVSEPVVRVLGRICAAHAAAATVLKRFVAEHDSPPIRARAFVALVEAKQVEGAEGTAWIRTLLAAHPDPALATLLELRLEQLGR